MVNVGPYLELASMAPKMMPAVNPREADRRAVRMMAVMSSVKEKALPCNRNASAQERARTRARLEYPGSR